MIEQYDQKFSPLHTIDFSSNLLEIGSNNFNNFCQLKEVILPNKLESIGSNCFNNLKSLKKVYIGTYVKELKDCFNECPEIEEIILDKWYKMPVENCFNAVDKSKCIVKVPKLGTTSGKEYYTSGFWKDFKVVQYDKESNIETVLNDPELNKVQYYDLSGRPISNISELNKGEIYVTSDGRKFVK